MTDWINRKFGSNLKEDDLKEIKNFTLLWNIYENIIFQCEFSIQKLEGEIKKRQFKIEELNDTLVYFQQRYIFNGEVNERFHSLYFRPNDKEDIVKQVLLNKIVTDHQKILAIGIIVYRFRNNLFHGLKDFMNLYEQSENFRNANIYLRVFLDSV